PRARAASRPRPRQRLGSALWLTEWGVAAAATVLTHGVESRRDRGPVTTRQRRIELGCPSVGIVHGGDELIPLRPNFRLRKGLARVFGHAGLLREQSRDRRDGLGQ